MWRHAVLGFCLPAILAAPAQAQAVSRYTSTAMSCAAAQAAIAREGAVILRHRSSRKPGLVLYDRYVAGDWQCPTGHRAARAYVPTADALSCPVMNCKVVSRERRLRRPFLFFDD